MIKLSRRRFLKISVTTSAAMIAPAGMSLATREPIIWHGIVLGADASIRVYGDKQKAQAAINAALKVIEFQEKQLSIYDPHSNLSRLNENGVLRFDDVHNASVHQLAQISKLINQKTDGLFDPTVQPLFTAYAKAQGYPSQKTLDAAQALVGLEKVDTSKASQISFKQNGMALTFNGIAQGFITDQVRRKFDALGYKHALINIGEYSAGSESAKIGIANADGEVFDVATLRNQAIATSSPSGYRFPNGTSHILHPNGNRHIAKWDTVSVIAENATLADGYSTALALTNDVKLAQKLVADQVVQKVILKDIAGEVHHIG